MSYNIVWLRRDLRLDDNTALHHAAKAGNKVQLLFIFDTEILSGLPKKDARVQFIHQNLQKINEQLVDSGASVRVEHGKPIEVWKKLVKENDMTAVFFNRDYEPYAKDRDEEVSELLRECGIHVETFKDQVIFEAGEVLKDDGHPYTVFTPYKNKWLSHFEGVTVHRAPEGEVFLNASFELPSLKELGFERTDIRVKDINWSAIDGYADSRDFPDRPGTTLISPHLRFGTVSVREAVRRAQKGSETYLSELIWREFFQQILAHFPRVVDTSFREDYDRIDWINDKDEFKLWCEGRTGFPIVDAGMRELNQTGYMHNRVRMIVASFLCKDLLIDWRWGEAYFAEKLLDYELASNNGNWQWAAGTGCDAAPYFRVFNPESQQKKFDPELKYVKQWVPEYGTDKYPEPMIDHKMARERALETYKVALAK